MVNYKNLQQFINNGIGANNTMSNYANNAVNNTQDFFNNIISGYKNSALFNSKFKDMINLLDNRTMANGKYGTMTSEKDIANQTNQLLDEDIQQFIENILGIQNQGLQTANQVSNTGASSASTLAQLQQQAEQFEQQNKSSFWTDLFKGLAGGTIGSFANSIVSPTSNALSTFMNSTMSNKLGNNGIVDSFSVNQSANKFMKDNPWFTNKFNNNNAKKLV